MSRDLIEVLSAFVLIAVCASIAIASAGPKHERPARERPKRERLAREKPAREKPLRRRDRMQTVVEELAEASIEEGVPVASDGRPRIFTGEPGKADPEPPAAKRAFRLVAGITVLAAAGALGLLALVRAMVAMFEKIGG